MATDATSLWICNGIALTLFLARLLLRKAKGQRFNAGDYWTMGASVFLIVRVVVSHYILLHGTTTSKFISWSASFYANRIVALSNVERANLANLGEEKTNWLVLNSKVNLVSQAVLNSM